MIPHAYYAKANRLQKNMFSFPEKKNLSQSSYTWRHNRELQELVIAKYNAKGLPGQPKATTQVFTLEVEPNPGAEVQLAWILRGKAYWMDVMTRNFQPISPNETNVLKSSKTEE
ncbi:hypothetical protein PoB_000081500 [Plakobranchus ocellatus]|uniref:Uncharacterized protein n=1 Tax=Plakobranchus ocellatus TaxID=259542 RepID=A0AAV3XUF7_9GAST|nr:hypothetical protein PoB_000081500 [Plakobranchus ocellatus]